jgi:hypothetical protein
MLHGAKNGILFRAKEELVKSEKLPSAKTYEELKTLLTPLL